jgi:hypothetical protein
MSLRSFEVKLECLGKQKHNEKCHQPYKLSPCAALVGVDVNVGTPRELAQGLMAGGTGPSRQAGWLKSSSKLPHSTRGEKESLLPVEATSKSTAK